MRKLLIFLVLGALLPIMGLYGAPLKSIKPSIVTTGQIVVFVKYTPGEDPNPKLQPRGNRILVQPALSITPKKAVCKKYEAYKWCEFWFEIPEKEDYATLQQGYSSGLREGRSQVYSYSGHGLNVSGNPTGWFREYARHPDAFRMAASIVVQTNRYHSISCKLQNLSDAADVSNWKLNRLIYVVNLNSKTCKLYLNNAE